MNSASVMTKQWTGLMIEVENQCWLEGLHTQYTTGNFSYQL